MCKFFILSDNDNAGIKAIKQAKNKSLIKESDYKSTSFNGSPNSDMKYCIKKEVYEQVLNEYNI